MLAPKAMQCKVNAFFGLLGLAVGVHPPFCICSLHVTDTSSVTVNSYRTSLEDPFSKPICYAADFMPQKIDTKTPAMPCCCQQTLQQGCALQTIQTTQSFDLSSNVPVQKSQVKPACISVPRTDELVMCVHLQPQMQQNLTAAMQRAGRECTAVYC